MVAEREGFEPSRQVTPPGGLANRCTRPLCDLSGPRPADSSRRPVGSASRGRTGRSGPRDRVGDRERGKHPFLCAGSPGGSDRRPRRAGPGPATGTGDRDWASDPVIGWHDRNRRRGAWKRGGSRGWPRFRARHGSGRSVQPITGTLPALVSPGARRVGREADGPAHTVGCIRERDRALTGSVGGRYRPGTVQAHHFLFLDPA